MLQDTQVLLEAVDNNVEWSKFKHLLKLKNKINIYQLLSIFGCKKKKVVNKLRQQSETKKVLFEAVDNQSTNNSKFRTLAKTSS